MFLPGESPRTEEPGGLQSPGWQRVRHGRATNTLERTADPRRVLRHEPMVSTGMSALLEASPWFILKTDFHQSWSNFHHLSLSSYSPLVWSGLIPEYLDLSFYTQNQHSILILQPTEGLGFIPNSAATKQYNPWPCEAPRPFRTPSFIKMKGSPTSLPRAKAINIFTVSHFHFHLLQFPQASVYSAPYTPTLNEYICLFPS